MAARWRDWRALWASVDFRRAVVRGLWSVMHCNYFIISGDENCLNLNVYSPKLDSKKRAVMVYFHGGAYIMGGKREIISSCESNSRNIVLSVSQQ